MTGSLGTSDQGTDSGQIDEFNSHFIRADATFSRRYRKQDFISELLEHKIQTLWAEPPESKLVILDMLARKLNYYTPEYDGSTVGRKKDHLQRCIDSYTAPTVDEYNSGVKVYHFQMKRGADKDDVLDVQVNNISIYVREMEIDRITEMGGSIRTIPPHYSHNIQAWLFDLEGEFVAATSIDHSIRKPDKRYTFVDCMVFYRAFLLKIGGEVPKHAIQYPYGGMELFLTDKHVMIICKSMKKKPSSPKEKTAKNTKRITFEDFAR